MRYLAVIEEGPTSWGAYVPDLPIILATDVTRDEVERRVREAIELYLEELAQRGEPAPVPTTQAVEVEV